MPEPQRAKSPAPKKRKSNNLGQETQSPMTYALWIAGSYFAVSFLWILFSGNLAGLFASDVASLAHIESVKGWFFVTVTAVLLFFYVNKMIKHVARHQDELDQMVRQRTAELESTAASLLTMMEQKDRLITQTSRQQRFQSIVLKLSQEFFNVPLAEMNNALNASLQAIGEYLNADRVTYAEIGQKQERLMVMGQWGRNENQPLHELQRYFDSLPFREAPCTIRCGMEFFTADAEPGLAQGEPPQAVRREKHTYVNAPIHIQGKHCGTVVISTPKSVEEWTDEDLNILNIFLEMLRNAYVRRKKEIELEQGNKLMRVVLDSTEDAIYMVDAQGVLHDANNAFAAFFKAPVHGVVGRNLKNFLPENAFLRLMMYVHSSLEAGQPSVLQSQYEGMWLENSIYPVADENGKYGLATIFSADITNRIQYESELFRSRQLFKQLIESAPVGIYWKDLDGKYLGCNKHMADNFGTTVEEMIGNTIFSYVSEEDAIYQTQLEQEMFKSHLPRINTQVKMKRQNGEVRLFNAYKVPLFTEHGDPYAILGVVEDITEQTHKEMELLEAKLAANDANAAKSMFLSRMSHEIRTPLNSIIGLTHIAAQSEEAARIKEYISQIGASSRHLLEIINDILDISRIEAGKLTVNKTKFDLISAMESAVGILMPRADEKYQHVNLYIDQNVPREVMSDQTRFKQVVVNLVTNAIKFTQEGGTIDVRAKTLRNTENGAVVSFSVQDDGVGIEEGQLSRIFEPFEQADTTFARSHEGTGLGLPICKSIVELMGGEISAESMPAQGSTFTFVLPLETAPDTQSEAVLSFDELRVLVVDDEAETRAYMKMLLSQYKVETRLAASGQEAVEQARAAAQSGEPFNVVFVDMRMPGMNGIETAQEIRKACGEKVIVIMFSMYEWSDIEKSAKEAGISMFLPKPIFPSKLLDVLYGITNGKRYAQAPAPQCDETAGLSGRRILVAEDNAVNQLILREMLAKTGAQLIPVSDGFQAVEEFTNAPDAFDAILMDIQMPGMDGFEATRAIRALKLEQAQTVPIIAMTANVFREDIEKAMLAGMDAHVGKPIDPDDLLGKLCKAINR